MANENKDAPGSTGIGGPKGGQKQGQDPSSERQNVSRYSGNQPHERPDYEENRPDRPGYDIDIETEIPGRKDASERDQPGTGKSGMGSGTGNGPEMDPSRPRTTRDIPAPDDERQAKKRP
ncbi:MAG TPA: hypothetical protein VFH68_26890 [Polyangia bacterium]|jgi:hypothetical protein|nr:hypothetical protein [Polyangia bacterium]